MSKTGLDAVVDRWMQDEAFRRELATNPAGALAGYDLTPEEAAAIARRDESMLLRLGVDERIVKSSLN